MSQRAVQDAAVEYWDSIRGRKKGSRRYPLRCLADTLIAELAERGIDESSIVIEQSWPLPGRDDPQIFDIAVVEDDQPIAYINVAGFSTFARPPAVIEMFAFQQLDRISSCGYELLSVYSQPMVRNLKPCLGVVVPLEVDPGWDDQFITKLTSAYMTRRPMPRH